MDSYLPIADIRIALCTGVRSHSPRFHPPQSQQIMVMPRTTGLLSLRLFMVLSPAAGLPPPLMLRVCQYPCDADSDGGDSVFRWFCYRVPDSGYHPSHLPSCAIALRCTILRYVVLLSAVWNGGLGKGLAPMGPSQLKFQVRGFTLAAPSGRAKVLAVSVLMI